MNLPNAPVRAGRRWPALTALLAAVAALVLSSLAVSPAQAVPGIAELDVTVQDATVGGNLVGATVTLYEAFQPIEPTALGSAATDVDGVAHFEFDHNVTVRIKIEKVGYYTKWGDQEVDSGFDYSSADNFSLTTGGATAKTVALRKQFRVVDAYTYDAPSGTDLSGVTVGLYNVAGDGLTPAAVELSGPLGEAQFKFDVNELAKGTYRLRASKAGYAAQWLTGPSLPNDFENAQDIDLTGDSYVNLDTFNLGLTPSGEVVTGPTPVVTGVAKVGQVLHAVPGTWSPSGVTLTYRWFRDGVALAANGSSYPLQAADLGAHLSVRVTGSKAGLTSASLDSAPTAAVVKGTFTTAPKPKITGTLKSGSKLRAKPGAWSPAPATLTYQWFRGAKAIPNATGKTYRLKAKDVGKRIRVRVKARRPGFVAKSMTSAKTAPVSG